MQKRLTDDSVRSKASLVDLISTIQSAIDAVSLVPRQTVPAITAAVVLVAEAHAVTLLQVLAVRAHGLNNTDAFVPEDNVIV